MLKKNIHLMTLILWTLLGICFAIQTPGMSSTVAAAAIWGTWGVAEGLMIARALSAGLRSE